MDPGVRMTSAFFCTCFPIRHSKLCLLCGLAWVTSFSLRFLIVLGVSRGPEGVECFYGMVRTYKYPLTLFQGCGELLGGIL